MNYLLLAQTNEILTNGIPGIPSPGSMSSGAFSQPQFYIDIGTLFIGAVLTAGVKQFYPLINKNVLPYLATFLALLAGALATVTIGQGVHSAMDMVKIVALALGNVTLRELKDKVIPENQNGGQPQTVKDGN